MLLRLQLCALLILKVTQRCRFGTWGEKTAPTGTIGRHTDLEMWLGCLSIWLKRIKVLCSSNWAQILHHDTFHLPWMTFTCTVKCVPLSTNWEQFCHKSKDSTSMNIWGFYFNSNIDGLLERQKFRYIVVIHVVKILFFLFWL